jgi:hypothetical protein
VTVATFDTLKYANKLKAGGVPGPQAEVEAEALSEALQVNLKELVTKDDLKREIAELRRELKDEMKVLGLALEKKKSMSLQQNSPAISPY